MKQKKHLTVGGKEIKTERERKGNVKQRGIEERKYYDVMEQSTAEQKC